MKHLCSIGGQAMLVALIAVAAAFPAWAQTASDQAVQPGNRVRLTLSADGSRLSGVLLASAHDAFRLTTSGGDVVTLPRTSVQVLEVSKSRKRSWLKGLMIGAAVGAAAGLMVRVGSEDRPANRAEAVGQGAVGFGMWGAAIGALVRTDRWVVVRF